MRMKPTNLKKILKKMMNPSQGARRNQNQKVARFRVQYLLNDFSAHKPSSLELFAAILTGSERTRSSDRGKKNTAKKGGKKDAKKSTKKGDDSAAPAKKKEVKAEYVYGAPQPSRFLVGPHCPRLHECSASAFR